MSEIAEFTRHLGHYLQPPDVALVERAFAVLRVRRTAASSASRASRTSRIRSRSPSILSPSGSSTPQALVAALLHDVMEDTARHQGRDRDDASASRSPSMVDGVSKLDKIEFQSREDAQAENFRKMLLAMARDVRVILIKLADRLHNMRTLDAMAPAQRRRIARETMDIYAPIANRLGLNALYLELQDLSFTHLYPLRYRDPRQGDQGGARQPARGDEPDARRRSREGFATASIAAVVTGREKTIYSVYKKMREKHYTFSQVFDIYGVRVLVAGHADVLSRARRAARAVQADPRQVQGLHRDPEGERLPVAAHDAVRPVRHAARGADPHARHAPRRRGRRRRALAVQVRRPSSTSPRRSARRTAGCRACSRSSPSRATRRSSSSTSRSTSSPTRSTCSRRRARSWRCRAARRRSTSPTRVHTDIGHHCVAARINYELVPLRTELKNGDHVEILTSPTRAPEPVVAVVRRDRQGALAHPPLPEGPAAEGVGGARRAAAEPGARDAEGRARIDHLGALGSARARSTARRRQLEILADIGLGKRLSFVVAQALTRPPARPDDDAAQAAATGGKPAR